MDSVDVTGKPYSIPAGGEEGGHGRSPRRDETIKTWARLAVVVSILALFHVWRTMDWSNCGRKAARYALTNAGGSKGDLCEQSEPLIPYANNDMWNTLSEYYSTDTFLGQAVDWLGGAVRIP